MSPKLGRITLGDGSWVEMSAQPIKPDQWRPHGVRYRLAWVQKEICRVLFDNHHGKEDHFHVDGVERPYHFVDLDTLLRDFLKEMEKLGAKYEV